MVLPMFLKSDWKSRNRFFASLPKNPATQLPHAYTKNRMVPRGYGVRGALILKQNAKTLNAISESKFNYILSTNNEIMGLRRYENSIINDGVSGH